MTASAENVLPRPTLSARMQPLYFFELVDDGEDRVFLKIVEHAPDLALLEAGGLVGQDIFEFAPVVPEVVDDFDGGGHGGSCVWALWVRGGCARCCGTVRGAAGLLDKCHNYIRIAQMG